MSKTAAEWVTEARKLGDANRKQEAIEYCTQAIAADPNYGLAYFYKAFYMPKNTEPEKMVLYKKAIEVGYINTWTCQNLGNSYMAQDRLQEAIDCYLSVIELDATKKFFWSLIGLLYEQMGDKEKAMEYYDLCLEKKVDIANSGLYKAKLLAQEGKYEEALESLKTGLAASPDHIELLYQNGNICRAVGQEEKALEHYNKAILKQPANPNDWCNRGLSFIALGRRNEGLADLKKTRSELETYDKIVYSPGYLNFMKATINSIVEAEELNTKTEAILAKLDHEKPAVQEFKATLEKLQDRQNQLIIQLGRQQNSEGHKNIDEFDQFKEEFNRKLDEIQVPENMRPKTAAEWVAEGNQRANEKKLKEAMECYDQALIVDPKYGEAYFYKAFRLPKDTDAEKMMLYQQALEVGYINTWTYQNLGNNYMALDRPEEAIKCYLKVVELNPSKSFFLSLVGLLYEQMGNKEEALRYYDICLEKNFDVHNAGLYKGKLLAQEGKYEEALKSLERGLAASQNHIELLYQNGNICRALGLEEKALGHYKKAIEKRPDNPNDWCNRGLAFIALDRREEGLIDLKKTRSELETYDKITYSPGYLNFMKSTINSILEAEELDAKAEALVEKLDHEKAAVQEFKVALEKFQDDKDKVQNKLIKQLARQQNREGQKNISEFDLLKEEFNKKLNEIEAPQNLKSKTAAEWVEEAQKLGNSNKKAEAVDCCDKAISVNPNYGVAYFYKAFYMPKGTDAEKMVLYEKAIEVGYIYSWTYQNLGNCYMAQDRLQEAIDCYLKVIELDETKNFFWSLIGLLYEQMGNKVKALEYYDLCLEKNIDIGNAGLYKGKLLAQEGKYEEALQVLEIGLEASPNHIELLYQNGNICMALGQEEKAIDHYEAAVEYDPENPNDWCNRGLAFIALDRREEGIDDLKKTQSELETFDQITYSPGYLNFMKATISSIVEAEELNAKTEALVQRLDEEKPAVQEFKAALEKLQERQNQLIVQLGRQQNNEGRQNIEEFNKFKEEFNKKLSEIDVPENMKPKTPADWVEEANNLGDEGNNEGAVECCDKAIEIDPTYGEAYFYKAYYMPKGTDAEKLVIHLKAIEVGYIHSWTYQNLGNNYMALDRPQEAINCYLKVIDLDSTKTFFWSLIGLLYEQMGNKEEAIRYYDLCLDKNVDLHNAGLYKGKLLAQNGEYEEALKCLEIGLEASPNHIEILYQNGNICRALGQEEKALGHYNKAVQRQPDNPNDWCNRGLSFIALGRREEGLADLKKTQSELETYDKITYSPGYLNFMKATINSIVEAEELDAKTEAIVEKLDHEKPAVQELKAALEKLHDDKEKVQNKLISQLARQQSNQAQKNLEEFDQIKEEFHKKLSEIQAKDNLKPDQGN